MTLLTSLRQRIRAARTRRTFWNRIEQEKRALEALEFHPKVLARATCMIVVSTGRTGTTWLANTLASDARALVHHEPIRREQLAWAAAFNDPDAAAGYTEFRLRYIQRDIQSHPGRIYVECNGALRRHGKDIKSRCPNVYLPLIIRDGRDIVASVMQRPSLTEADPVLRSVASGNSVLGRRWSSLDKFQKICLLWRVENEYALQYADKVVRFEDMMSDYQAFHDCFCQPTGIHVDAGLWSSRSRVKDDANCSTRRYGWAEWNGEQRGFFRAECGALMTSFGYW
jgi:hypothetical protein